jgi:serine/threonine protein kinase
MVLEHVEGRSLHSVLANNKPLPVSRMIGIMTQLVDALSCAHSSGIIHRDLKPSNVLLVGTSGVETVKVIDFGLAKLMPGQGVEAQKLTEDGMALGTAHYMSPEQCVGKELTPAADIYSAGVIIYQCLTGQLPFDADNNVSVMFQHINEPPPSLMKVAPYAVPFQAVLERALAKEPDRRQASAAELMQELKEAAAQLRSDPKPRVAARSSREKRAAGLPPMRMLLAAACVLVCGLAMMLFLTPVQRRDGTTSIDLYRQVADLDDLKDDPTRMFTSENMQIIERALASNAQDHLLSPSQQWDLLVMLGDMYEQRNNHRLALQCFKDALKFNLPGTVRRRRWYVENKLWLDAESREDHLASLAIAQQMQRDNLLPPEDMGMRLINGRLAISDIYMQRFSEAERLIRNEPDFNSDPEARRNIFANLGNAYAAESRWAEALSMYDQAERLGMQVPTDSARANMMLGRWQTAKQILTAHQTKGTASAMLQAVYELKFGDKTVGQATINEVCRKLEANGGRPYRLFGADVLLASDALRAAGCVKEEQRLAALWRRIQASRSHSS